jgi:hypothetical protein
VSYHITAGISDHQEQSHRSLRGSDQPRRMQVAELARERLAGSSYPALRGLRCHFHEGVLTVRGQLPSYHLRQVAWKLVSDLPGVKEFVDRVEVVDRR